MQDLYSPGWCVGAENFSPDDVSYECCTLPPESLGYRSCKHVKHASKGIVIPTGHIAVYITHILANNNMGIATIMSKPSKT